MSRRSLARLAPFVLLFVAPATRAADSVLSISDLCVLSALLLLAVCGVLAWRLRQARQASQQWHDTLDSVGLALLTVGHDNRIVRSSTAFHALTGVPAGVLALSDFPLVWRAWLDQHVREARDSGKSAPENRLISPGEEAPTMLLRLSAVRTGLPDGSQGVLLWCESLTSGNDSLNAVLEREHTLRTRSQHFIQTLIDVIPRPVYVKDDAGRYILANESFCAQHGRRRTEVIGHSAAELAFDTQHAQAIALEDARVMAGAPIFKEEFTASPDKPGEDRFTIVSKQSCLDPEGRRVLVGTHIDITPWRLAERELQAALRREKERSERTKETFQRLIDALPYPVCIKDAASHYIMVNDPFVATRGGATREDLLNRDALDIARSKNPPNWAPIATSRAEDSLNEDQQVLAGNNIRKEENQVADQHGVLHDRIVTKTACLDPEGNPMIVVSMVDITELRDAQRSIVRALDNETARRERTEAFVQRLIDVIPSPVYVRSLDGHYLFVNDAFVADRGRSRELILSRCAWATPEVEQRVRTEDAQVVAGMNIYKEEHIPHYDSGKERWRIISKRACADPDGNTVIVGTNFDVTLWRKAERDLQQTLESVQAFTQRLLDVIPEPVYVKDAASRYILINDAFAAQRQQDRAEILGKTARELAPSQEIADKVLAEDAEVLNGATVHKVDPTPHPLTGKPRWRIITKGSCLDPKGDPVIVGASFDITAVRVVEQQLQAALETEQSLRERTQEFIQHLLDALPLPICVRDQQCRHLHVNASFIEEVGLPREAIVGSSVADFVADQDIVASSMLEDRAAFEGQNYFEEKQDTGLGGTEIGDRLISKRCCLDVDQRPVLVVAHIDVTAQREAERNALALMASEKSLRTRTQEFIQRMIDVIPHPFFIKDQESRYILINKALSEEFNLPPEAVLGHSTLELAADPTRAEAIMAEDLDVLAGATIYEERHETCSTSGKDWADRIVSKQRCLDVDGRPVLAVSHLDVTEFRNTQRQLESAMQRESMQIDRMREFLQRVIDVIPQEFYIKDADSRVLMVNPVYLKRRHLSSAAEVIGLTAPEIGDSYLERDPWLQEHPDELPSARATLHQRWEEARQEDLEVLQGRTIIKEVCRRRPGGAGEHRVVIAKSSCTDITGQQVIVCASYDVADLQEILSSSVLARQVGNE